MWVGKERIGPDYVGIHGAYHDSAEVVSLRYLTFQDKQGRGHAFDACTGILGALTAPRTAARVVAEVARGNEPSIRLAKKLGLVGPVPHDLEFSEVVESAGRGFVIVRHERAL